VLPLGPANDADPNVAIEIRAAEIAAYHEDMKHQLSVSYDTTIRGNYGPPDYSGMMFPAVAEEQWFAGWLARCIVKHDSNNGDV
jgi:hypothetical protein